MCIRDRVYRVINAILETEQSDITVAQAYLQIVLARCIGTVSYTHLVWQMAGYDTQQYTNIRYPFPFDPPYVPQDIPCLLYTSYRRLFALPKREQSF